MHSLTLRWSQQPPAAAFHRRGRSDARRALHPPRPRLWLSLRSLRGLFSISHWAPCDRAGRRLVLHKLNVPFPCRLRGVSLLLTARIDRGEIKGSGVFIDITWRLLVRNDSRPLYFVKAHGAKEQ